MPVTLRDVASKAGVSPVVVSRVLHNKAQSIRVSEATAERVREAALELGYRCNVFARNFRAQQTFTLGVLHGTGFARPRFDMGSRYFGALVDGLIEGAFHHGYSVTFCPKLLSQTPEDAMCDGRFDGLIWYSSVSSDENLEALASSTVPLVLIHARSSDFGNKHPSVICDNEQGIKCAVDHLVELGHRRIAFAMNVEPTNLESTTRLAAFRHHLARHGIPCDAESVLEVDWTRTAVDRYLSGGLRHTAIVAQSDGLAAEFMLNAQDRGIRVPEDLSIIGFDSTTYCEELRPSLTSIHQPLQEMGARAIDLLVDCISGKPLEQLEYVYPCRLDVRDSTSSSSYKEVLIP